MRESVQYHTDNAIEVNKNLEGIDKRVEEIKLDEITEDFAIKTKKKLTDLEDRSRRKNLSFDGFQEETNATWEESESIIMDFLKGKLVIEEGILIETAHRTGKIQRNDGTRNRRRTIVVKFLNFKDIKNSTYLQRNEAVEGKSLCKRRVFRGDSKHL